MKDLDTLTDRLARAVAACRIGWGDFIPASALLNHCEWNGLDVKQAPDLLAAFVARFPAWHAAPKGKGAELNPEASAHAKMAWAAFVRRCQVEAGVAS